TWLHGTYPFPQLTLGLSDRNMGRNLMKSSAVGLCLPEGVMGLQGTHCCSTTETQRDDAYPSHNTHTHTHTHTTPTNHTPHTPTPPHPPPPPPPHTHTASDTHTHTHTRTHTQHLT